MGFEEDYIHGMRCYQISTREIITTNHIRLVDSNVEYQLSPKDWPHIIEDGGTGKLLSQAENKNAKPVTDFQYLIGTYHLDDEDGLLYKVTRVGIYKGYVVCWRKLVLSDGTLHKEDKRSLHAQDVADLTDLTGDSLSGMAPLLPKDVTWSDRTSAKNFTSGTERSAGQVTGASPQSLYHEVPNLLQKANGRPDSKCDNNREVDPSPYCHKRKLKVGIPPAESKTRNHLSRSCKLPKNCDNNPMSATASTAKVSMGPKMLNRLTTSIHYGNIFCTLAFIAFTAMITLGNPEVYLSTTYLPPDPTTHRQAMISRDRDEWLEAEAKEFRSLLENGVFSECKLPPGRRTVRTKWVYKLKRDK